MPVTIFFSVELAQSAVSTVRTTKAERRSLLK
jgi:hypothetical protein